MTITSNLKALLAEREMSIRELSRRTGHTFESVRNLYNNKMERFPRELIGRVCGVLGIEVSELLILGIKKERQ